MALNQTAAAPSHKMRRCLLMAFALIALPTASFAGTDTAGNALATDNDANPSGVEGDLYWAGQALNLDDASINHDIIAAGDTLSIRDCTVGGAVRLAARTRSNKIGPDELSGGTFTISNIGSAGSVSSYVSLVMSGLVSNVAALVVCVAVTMGLRWLSLRFDIKSPTEEDIARFLHRKK